MHWHSTNSNPIHEKNNSSKTIESFQNTYGNLLKKKNYEITETVRASLSLIQADTQSLCDRGFDGQMVGNE